MVTELLYKSASEPVNRSFEIGMAAILSTIHSLKKSGLDLPVLMEPELRKAKETTSQVTFSIEAEGFRSKSVYNIDLTMDSSKKISLSIGKDFVNLSYEKNGKIMEIIQWTDKLVRHEQFA